MNAHHADEVDDAQVRRLVRSAFDRNPDDGWTPERLAARLGLPHSAVGRVLTDLAGKGLIAQVDDEYVPAFPIR